MLPANRNSERKLKRKMNAEKILDQYPQVGDAKNGTHKEFSGEEIGATDGVQRVSGYQSDKT